MFDEKYILCHCMTFKVTVFIFVKFKDTVFIFVKSLEILKTEIILTYCTCRPTSYSTIKLSIMYITYLLFPTLLCFHIIEFKNYDKYPL